MDIFCSLPAETVYITDWISIKKTNASHRILLEMNFKLCFVESFFLPRNMCLSCVKADYFLPFPEYHEFFCKINKALSSISEITRGSPCLRSKMHITARPSATSSLSVKWKLPQTGNQQNKTLTSSYPRGVPKKNSFVIQRDISKQKIATEASLQNPNRCLRDVQFSGLFWAFI